MNYTELDWRWAILLGVAIRDGLLGAVADRSRGPDEVAGELGVLEEGVSGCGRSTGHRSWSAMTRGTSAIAWSTASS